MEKNNQSFMPKLIFLCFITTSIVTTLSFSKFQSAVTGISNTAIVSRPALNIELAGNQEESLTIDCNTDDTSVNYSIVVSNKDSNIVSEVSLKYDIIITLPTEITSGFTIKVDDIEACKNKNTYTIENVGQFSPSTANEKTHTLTFAADPDIIRSGIFKNATITAHAEQID